MGITLIVEVLDHAPADLTPAERLVLVVLAEYANDQTRECWPGIDKIAARAGLEPDSVRRVFQRLARRTPPLEVRVAIGHNKSGKPVFAREGAKTTYRLPPLKQSRDESPASTPWGDESPATEAGPQSHRGGTVVAQRRDDSPPLTLNEPSENPHPPKGKPSRDENPPSRDGLHPIPEDFTLTDAMRRWAIQTFGPNLDVDHETRQFLSHHLAEGSRRRSWPDEWQKWIRRSARWASERASRPPLRAVNGWQPYTNLPDSAYTPTWGTSS